MAPVGDEWVTTGEVADRLGYVTRWYLKRRLREVGIPSQRRTSRQTIFWHWPSIQARVALPVGDGADRVRVSIA